MTASMFAFFAMTQEASELAKGLASYGAVGLCLVALATWYILKDRKYEVRIDERLLREAQFQAEYAALLEKYRAGMEKFSSALDAIITIVKSGVKEG